MPDNDNLFRVMPESVRPVIGHLSCLLLLLCTASLAYADVNPEVAREQQLASATEWVEIQVTAVWVENLERDRARVAATAVVRRVEKTASDLKPGDSVLIAYTLDFGAYERYMAELAAKAEEGFAGLGSPGLPIIVSAGQRYQAYLSLQTGPDLQGAVYSPTAAGYSFEVRNSVTE